jgi:hypothetical protein
MSAQRYALLLVGSPRAARSTSESLGTFLLDRLRQLGLETGRLRIHSSLKSQEGRDSLLSAVEQADLVVLASPLYIDSLPAPVIRALELIRQCGQGMQSRKRRSWLAILNSGFPEAQHNRYALEMCRRFAAELGFDWAGGLGLGMGEAIAGRPLSRIGWMGRNVRRSLVIAAAALAAGKPVPETAVTLMARPLVPQWMYVWFGYRRWKRQAKQQGGWNDIERQPYQKRSESWRPGALSVPEGAEWIPPA